MTHEIEQKLSEIFPFMSECSFECGEGWNDLIWSMVREIDDAFYDFGKSVDFCIMEIKEKFGEMRVYYYSNTSTKIDGIIDKHVGLSKSTCEICGAEGKLLRDDYWITVRCEDCRI